ncbi:hypothetical protein KR032_004774 [Drosophila birchii]|nr:hypothetical protein KR032_004774 [Drosophila birchii]
MDLCAFPDIDIDHLLDATTALEDGFLAPFKQVSLPKANGGRTREKRSRLAERIAQGDELIRQVKQLQAQTKQLADLQRTAQEVTDLYQKEKQQRLELQAQSQQLGERCAELEKQLDAQVIQCENLQEELGTRTLPVNAKEVLGILLQLDHRLGDDAGLTRRDQNTVKKLKDYCKAANISMPAPKSPCQRNKRRSQATQTDAAPLPEKPAQCTVAVQVENLIQSRDQGTQHKNTTTTRGTTTASFIRKHDVGTGFPEPKPLPNVRQILDEMLSWRDKPLRPLSPLCDLEDIPATVTATVSVATCTTLCNIHREIDFLSEMAPQIKVSASRPPSRTMLDSVKEEARSTRELTKEMFNFLPQNQSCLANLPPQAFEELWQLFGQIVLGLLQRRSLPPTVSQADFTSWLYELYEGKQGQCAAKKGKTCNKTQSVSGLIQTEVLLDFSGSTECLDIATDPIIASPNISHGGDVTPIRLPPKPRDRKHKSKKRKSAAALIKPIAKRKCQEEAVPVNEDPEEQEPETAIQFLSNCDNLDMELDKEEMYKPAMQAEQEQVKEGEIQALPELHEESESSLKDAKAVEHTKNTADHQHQIPEGIASKEAEPENLPSLPDLFLEESNPSESDSDSEDNFLQRLILNCEPCKSNESNGNAISDLFGSDSDTESEASEQEHPKGDSELEKETSKSKSKSFELPKKITKGNPFVSESESCRELLSTEEETELEPKELEEELERERVGETVAKEHNPTNLKILNESNKKADELEKKRNNDLPRAVEMPADQADLVPSLPNLSSDSHSDLEKKVLQVSSPAPSSSDDSEEDHQLIIDIEMSPSIAPEDSPPLPTCKRRRTQSEFKSPPDPGECRLTRQKAKQLLLEQNCSTEKTPSLVEQIRRQLKQALNKSEPLKEICYPAPVNPKDLQAEQSYRCNEESPASPPPCEPITDSITEIPLEQSDGLQHDGQPKSIIQHVIDQYKADPKLSQLRRKTLGKSQQKLCASVGKYLEESLELEAFSLEVYKLTKDAAVIVNAMVVVVTKMGLEENPLGRLLSAVKHFDCTQRFLAELEERLFRNTKERPPTELAMKYVKLYLAAVSHSAQEYANPARLLLAKLLYHYKRDMPATVLEVLRQFPTVLPHREERQYNHSDPLITVIKHLLMGRTYDMQEPEGAERLLLSKLRFEYHYQPFEPTQQQVLENLVEKLKAGRSLDQLGYAFALFCRRSPSIKALDLVVTEHLMPLATSYCDLAAAQDQSYDDRLVAVVMCISMVLKPLPLDTDISGFVGLVKRLIVAVPRPGVQQAAVQACLRLQRFGFQTIRDALQNYRPDYPLDPLTRAMLRCYAERRKLYHILAPKRGATK